MLPCRLPDLRVCPLVQVVDTLRSVLVCKDLPRHRNVALERPQSCHPTRVRVLILLDEESDDDQTWLAPAASNPSFDFLKEAGEDIYCPSDGNPYR